MWHHRIVERGWGWAQMSFQRSVMAVMLGGALASCAHYTVPGGPADFRALGVSYQEAVDATDPSIAEVLDRKPAASFPATIAVVRLQGPFYRSYTTRGYGSGAATVVTMRDIESEESIAKLQDMPMVRGIAALNRLVVPEQINNLKDLRKAAAQVHADLVLLYTLDTRFGVKRTIPFMGTITLGLFPNQEARVTSTASAAIIDTRTGYIYGLAESTSKKKQLANGWTSRDATDQARRRAEREAFDNLVDEVTATWSSIVSEYGPQGT